MIDEPPTISEMLDKHPEIEYIRLLWIWEDDISDCHFIRVKNCLPASPVYKIDSLDEEYSYVGPYISDDDKVAFHSWIDAYGADDWFDELYIDDIRIVSNEGDRGLKITCLCGEVREHVEGLGKEYSAHFEFTDVYRYGSQGEDPYGVFDVDTHTILFDRGVRD